MPGRDGTGPYGISPLTGKQAGNCSEGNYPEIIIRRQGRRVRRGGGFRFGFRRRFCWDWKANPEQDVSTEQSVITEVSPEQIYAQLDHISSTVEYITRMMAAYGNTDSEQLLKTNGTDNPSNQDA